MVRPMAFLVRDPTGISSIYMEEDVARRQADAWGVEYQGLCVRDGTDDLPPGIQWHLDFGGHNGRIAGHALRVLNEVVELCVVAGARREEIVERITQEINKTDKRGDFSDTWSPDLFEEMAD